jgi:hypothetical protein
MSTTGHGHLDARPVLNPPSLLGAAGLAHTPSSQAAGAPASRCCCRGGGSGSLHPPRRAAAWCAAPPCRWRGAGPRAPSFATATRCASRRLSLGLGREERRAKKVMIRERIESRGDLDFTRAGATRLQNFPWPTCRALSPIFAIVAIAEPRAALRDRRDAHARERMNWTLRAQLAAAAWPAASCGRAGPQRCARTGEEESDTMGPASCEASHTGTGQVAALEKREGPLGILSKLTGRVR